MRRLSLLAVLGAIFLAADAPAQPGAPPGEQTHPSVAPRHGTPRTSFVLHLTARENLGVRGVLATSYSVQITGPGGRCSESLAITSGAAGTRLRRRLPRPGSGWCRGRYRGAVLLERGPYCPRPGPGQPPRPCPLFATQALDAGHFSVRVS
jgi:hypothetical protein